MGEAALLPAPLTPAAWLAAVQAAPLTRGEREVARLLARLPRWPTAIVSYKRLGEMLDPAQPLSERQTMRRVHGLAAHGLLAISPGESASGRRIANRYECTAPSYTDAHERTHDRVVGVAAGMGAMPFSWASEIPDIALTSCQGLPLELLRETEAAERRSVSPRPADESAEPRPAPRLVPPVAALARTAPPPRPPAAAPEPRRPAKKLGGGPDGPLLPLFDMGPTFRADILRRWQETGLQAVERVLSEPLARRDLARTKHALTALVTSDATIEKPGGWLVRAIRSAEAGKPYELKNTHPLGMSRLRRINAAINDAHGPTRSAQVAHLEQERFREGRRLAAEAEAIESIVSPLAAPTFEVMTPSPCPLPPRELLALCRPSRALPPPMPERSLSERLADLDRQLASPHLLTRRRWELEDARAALAKKLPAQASQ